MLVIIDIIDIITVSIHAHRFALIRPHAITRLAIPRAMVRPPTPISTPASAPTSEPVLLTTNYWSLPKLQVQLK